MEREYIRQVRCSLVLPCYQMLVLTSLKFTYIFIVDEKTVKRPITVLFHGETLGCHGVILETERHQHARSSGFTLWACHTTDLTLHEGDPPAHQSHSVYQPSFFSGPSPFHLVRRRVFGLPSLPLSNLTTRGRQVLLYPQFLLHGHPLRRWSTEKRLTYHRRLAGDAVK
jgi:hypothetical protein